MQKEAFLSSSSMMKNNCSKTLSFRECIRQEWMEEFVNSQLKGRHVQSLSGSFHPFFLAKIISAVQERRQVYRKGRLLSHQKECYRHFFKCVSGIQKVPDTQWGRNPASGVASLDLLLHLYSVLRLLCPPKINYTQRILFEKQGKGGSVEILKNRFCLSNISWQKSLEDTKGIPC